jgi:hypothetical protein
MIDLLTALFVPTMWRVIIQSLSVVIRQCVGYGIAWIDALERFHANPQRGPQSVFL